MKVIALGHYSRTGKDSLANLAIKAIKEYNPKLRVGKIPFAWKLKQICFELYSWDGMREPEFYETEEGAPYRDIVLPTIGKTPVQIWVDMGTPAVRDNVFEKTWIDYVFKTDHNLDVLFVPDTRFHNEIDAAEEFGDDALVAKVVRPGFGPRKTVADRALVSCDRWHYVFGGGTVADLRPVASQIARWVSGGPKPSQTLAQRRLIEATEVIEPWEQAA